MKTFLLIAILTAPVSALAEGGWRFTAHYTATGVLEHTRDFTESTSTIVNKMDCLTFTAHIYKKLVELGAGDDVVLKCRKIDERS